MRLHVDYSLIGHPDQFRTRIAAGVRESLRVGDTVVVGGDDVAPAPARVLAIAGPEVELQLLREVKARVDVGLGVGGGRTLASLSEATPSSELAAGDVVAVSDGEVRRFAVVDSIEGETLSLVVLEGSTAP